MEQILKAGYAQENITPDFVVCLSGAGDEHRRQADGVAHDIFATCVAVSDGEKTVLIITNDVISSTIEVTNEIKQILSEDTGIPQEQIYIGNIHSHSTPRLMRHPTLPGSIPFTEMVIEKLRKVVKDAIADMDDATLHVGSTQLPGYVAVRHSLMEDGTYSGPNFGNANQRYLKEATRPDETLMVVRFKRGEKQDILMVNWGAHPCRPWEVGRTKIMPDYVGHLRDRLSELSRCLVTFIPGCSGNQIMDTYIPGRAHKMKHDAYGVFLANAAFSLLPRLEHVEGTKIKNVRLTYQARANHADEDKVPQAKEVVDLFYKTDRDTANKLAWEYGMTSVYHAMSILGRPARGPYMPLELNAFSIGELGFATFATETPSTTSLAVRYNSPFKNTVMLCRNFTYIPAYAAYDYGSYEGTNTPYAQGTAEEATQRMTEMLCKIYYND